MKSTDLPIEIISKDDVISVLVNEFKTEAFALFEHLLQEPANRIGHQVLTVGQLKITQEVITLLVFVPFSLFYLKEKLTWDYLWAGLCLLGAVFFLFRGKLMG